MLISEVIANVKAYCGQTWDGPIYDDTTRDQVLYGPVDVACTGIVTTCFASADVIRQAHARGANLIICHEALFWNHGDHTCWLANNKTFAAKQALLNECGITVWRLHDHIHSGAPENGRLVDSIFMGLADKLGWRDYVTGNPDCPMNFTIPETTAGELARFLVARLGLNGTRIVGDADARVRTVKVPMHLIGQFDNETTAAMDAGVDCLVTMEATDFTTSEYVRDSAQLGLGKAMICIGHFNVEEPGMEYMLRWLPEASGADVPMSFVASGDPWTYVTA